MRKFILAVMLFVGVVGVASAAQPRFVVQRNRFPVANAIGRAINRVVGFPFRIAGAALGFQPRSRVIVGRNQFRAAPVILRQHVPRQRVIIQQGYSYGNTQQFSLRQTAGYRTTERIVNQPEQYQTERIVERVVAQPTERIVERVVTRPTERIIEREVVDDCPPLRQEVQADYGCVSQFRVQRVRASYRGY